MTEARNSPFVYLDSNSFMYGVEGEPALARPLQDLFVALRSRLGAGVASELVLAELLAPVRRPGALPQNQRRRAYLSLLVWDQSFALRPVTRDVLLETADLRSTLRLKLPDAVHMVTAVQARCPFIMSNDGDLSRPPAGLSHVRPDAQLRRS